MRTVEEIHVHLERFMDARQGCWRILGHFILYAAGPLGTGYVLFAAGGSSVWLLVASWPLAVVGLMLIVMLESCDLANAKHDWLKALIDGVSKSAGLLTGVTTWTWWWN